MKWFLAIPFLASLVFGEGIGETKKKHEFICGDFPITYQSLDGTHQPVDAVLHRWCPNMFVIDFNRRSQNLTVYAPNPNLNRHEQQFFLKPEYGDRFLMKKANDPKDPGVNITLVNEIRNMSHEESLKYQMFPVRITRREELPRMANNETYILAELHEKNERVRLSPGWYDDIEHPTDMITQVMLPENGAKPHQQAVTIMPGWLSYNAHFSGVKDQIHATTNHGHGIEYITIFKQKPNLDDLIPGSLDIQLTRKNDNGETKHEPAKLTPGWIGRLQESSKQVLIAKFPGRDEPVSLNVTVWPGAHVVNPKKGVLAFLRLAQATDVLTIYFTAQPETDPENRMGMFEIVDIVKQGNQTFRDEKAALSPGWFGVLKSEIQQTLIAYADDHTAFVGQNATVRPGWRVFVGNNHGFNAHYRKNNVHFPISVELKSDDHK